LIDLLQNVVDRFHGDAVNIVGRRVVEALSLDDVDNPLPLLRRAASFGGGDLVACES
jgi:hypothetical protein